MPIFTLFLLRVLAWNVHAGMESVPLSPGLFGTPGSAAVSAPTLGQGGGPLLEVAGATLEGSGAFAPDRAAPAVLAHASSPTGEIQASQPPPAPPSGNFAPDAALTGRFWVVIHVSDKEQRTRIVEAGVDIIEVYPDRVEGIATEEAIERLSRLGIAVADKKPLKDIFPTDFPPEDSVYHNYKETMDDLLSLVRAHPRTASLVKIGKSVEEDPQGRREYDIVGIRINTSEFGTSPSAKPGIVFMGAHHAREHLSVEVPLMLAKYLLEHKNDESLKKLVDSRDIYVFPMINPAGAEYDIQTARYRYWRKNRNDNGGSFGVDLNRNYGYKWGGRGASQYPGDETYRGPSAFSEAETQAVRDFVNSKPNIKILLSYHTFSELILYPWGHTYDPVSNERDRRTFEKMAKTMSKWNGYTPQQSSDLYIASGDTTDWAYGEKGIFAFTFELSPRGGWGGGGFYPGPDVIQPTFDANLKPAIFLIDLADDPYRVLTMPDPAPSS